MRLRIRSGLGIISIGHTPGNNYFRYKKPQVVVWGKASPTVERYLHVLPTDDAYRQEVSSRLTTLMETDFSGDFRDLYPLFPIFPRGQYELKYDDQADDNKIVFATAGATRSVYDGYANKIYATQTKEEINLERVTWYEEKIRNGERPFAILFRNKLDVSDLNSKDYIDSDTFVVDGHHKLIAYENLKIKPAVIEFIYLTNKISDVDYNVDELVDVVHGDWQIDDIIDNIYQKDKYISKYLNNPLSKIHDFLSTDFHQEYYDNGVKKAEWQSLHGIVHGKKNEWYENGNIKNELLYKRGMLHGEQITHYENGHRKEMSHWIKGRRLSGVIEWYENGRIAFSETFEYEGIQLVQKFWHRQDGSLLADESLFNGAHFDDISYREYHENGNIKAAHYFKDNVLIEVKEYDASGNPVNTRKF